MSRPDARDTTLSVMLVALALVLAWLMWPPRVPPVLELKFSRNDVPIHRLNQPRSVRHRSVVHVDALDLANDGKLSHPRLGELGYGEHFFLDMDAAFEVMATGQYRFVVASSDGFELAIDGQPVCGHSGIRVLTTQTCQVRLERGRRALALRYFQATGEAGLSVRYQRQGERALHWLGRDSRHVRFER